ncbi:MAG: ABC transporter ATP-binding protein [Desulfovibrionaceae bacterium]|nr:ABC transporter ATP-binding protein [Desulfovibrionaceae bacterium]
MTPLLSVRDLAVSCGIKGQGSGRRTIFSGVSLTVESGKLVAVVGANGSGKSTLLRAVCGLIPPDAGTIALEGTNLAELTCRERARFIAYLPQETEALPFTVEETVLLGRAPWQGFLGFSDQADREAARRAMRLAGVEELAARPLSLLSGGERQRVYWARALCQSPRLLLLDEPTSAQDFGRQVALMNMLAGLCREHGLAALMVSHDLNLASLYADSLLLLHGQGAAAPQGAPEDVLTQANLEKAYHCRLLLDAHPCVRKPRITLPAPTLSSLR